MLTKQSFSPSHSGQASYSVYNFDERMKHKKKLECIVETKGSNCAFNINSKVKLMCLIAAHLSSLPCKARQYISWSVCVLFACQPLPGLFSVTDKSVREIQQFIIFK